ncbi:hypothetical protein [Nesterenkonia sphaerica]|uniref:DUF3188 domain-containing protein n=1 Tax=Nesterenkonia sphaerica TaxID=1804988 RepID=A0A5R9AFZ3_9MICC|nr:hypothetical protein [Nesterenkonia sphaerica]TLP77074.1 hypothetical protein FEF27_05130 [Nesterenkonia sphaerica]
MTDKPFDPWASGTPAYRAALVTGMVCSFVGVVILVVAAMNDSSAFRTIGIVLICLGLVSHVTGIGLRKRQALHIIRERKSQG